MTAAKSLGIWMNHSKAHFIELAASPMENKTIESEFAFKEKVQSLSKSETIYYNKQKHQQTTNYKN